MTFYRIILVFILVFIFTRCNQSPDDKWLNEIQSSQIQQYIDFNKNLSFFDDSCLSSIKLAFHDVIWDTNTVDLHFGMIFTPRKELNIRPLNVRGAQEIYFVLKTCYSNNGIANCNYEAFFYSTYFEHFRPCYFNENATLYVDTVIDIIPNFEKLGNYCIFKHTGKHQIYGVFESFNPNEE